MLSKAYRILGDIWDGLVIFIDDHNMLPLIWLSLYYLVLLTQICP